MKVTSIIIGSLTLIMVLGAYNYSQLKLSVAMAKGQIEVFEQAKLQAKNASPQEAKELLQYVLNYYPSGTKHSRATRLDFIVETARSNSVKEIKRRIESIDQQP